MSRPDIEQIQSEIRMLQKWVSDLERINVQFQERVQALEHTLSAVENENRQLLSRCTRLTTENLTMRQTMSDQERKLSALQSENGNRKGRISALEANNAALKEGNAMLSRLLREAIILDAFPTLSLQVDRMNERRDVAELQKKDSEIEALEKKLAEANEKIKAQERVLVRRQRISDSESAQATKTDLTFFPQQTPTKEAASNSGAQPK